MDQANLLAIASPVVGVPLVGYLFLRHHFSDHNHARRLLQFHTLDECMKELDNIEKATNLEISNAWSLFQNLRHCTQSIAYSITGYPENKPKIIQQTIGKLVFHQFEHQGYMRHDRNEPLPGDAPIPAEGNISEAAIELRKVITEFENFTGALKPHFAYGKLTKTEFANAHCMHLADHFAIMTY